MMGIVSQAHACGQPRLQVLMPGLLLRESLRFRAHPPEIGVQGGIQAIVERLWLWLVKADLRLLLYISELGDC